MGDITGSPGDDVIVGTDGNDHIRGLGGRDVIDGKAGNDIIDGGDGNDDISGGAGNDILRGGEGNDWLFDVEGADDQLFGEGGNDELRYRAALSPHVAQALLDGGDGDDVLEYSAYGYEDFGTLIGGSGDDIFIVNGGAVVQIDAGAGADLLRIANHGTQYQINLGAGSDVISLLGYPGDPGIGIINVSDFGAGAGGDALSLVQYLAGTLRGWDQLTNPFASGHLQLVQRGADAVVRIDRDGAGGEYGFVDLVVLQNVSASALNAYNLGYAASGVGTPGVVLDGSAGRDLLIGAAGDDLIRGLDGSDTIFGGAGNDRLEGGAGDDILDGQLGNDELFGGAGDDVLSEVLGGHDSLFGEDGNDFISVDLQFASGAASTALLNGGNGDDTLIFFGRQIDDATLSGGDGDDRITVANGREIIIDGGAGAEFISIDLLASSYAITLGAGSDILELRPTLPLASFTPFAVLDFLTGNGGDEIRMQGFLQSNLVGWNPSANPFATGRLRLVQTGADTRIEIDRDGGGNSFQLLGTLVNVAAAQLTQVNLGFVPAGVISIYGTAGDDLIRGTSDNDTLYGLDGNDQLIGGAGIDVTVGGAGDDWHFVDNAADRVVELGGEGRDIVYASVSYALGAGVHVEALSAASQAGTEAINLVGNEFDQLIVGNAGNNTLRGGGGIDVLYGLAGNDTLIGDAGIDVTVGGSGDDLHFIDNAADRVVELADEGRDTVYASVSYGLGAGVHVEALSAASQAGTEAINLIGNEFDQLIVGNAGNNTLNGGGGIDVLYGLAGNDILIGGAGIDVTVGGTGDDHHYVDHFADRIVELAGEGRDTVYAGVSYGLATGVHVEAMSTAVQAGTEAINLIGNEFDQLIVGNAGNNTLNGGGGADVLYGLGGNDTLIGGIGIDVLVGGAGDDLYFVDDTADRIVELAGEGRDTIYASVSYALAAGVHVEAMSTAVQAGMEAINLTGNEFDQLVVGNAGSNVLNGGGGNDTLYGLGGADTFTFTAALGTGNVDLIADFASGTDRILLGGESGQPFAALASGSLGAGAFRIGETAAGMDDRIIYNQATGTIAYDADGSGAGVAIIFARVAAGTSLTAADFVVSGVPNAVPTINSGGTATIAENNAVGAVVYQTAASDANGDTISYRLGGPDQALFTVDAAGVVRAAISFDFEARSTYQFTVEAYDSSGSGSTRAVTLSVTDISEGGIGPTPTVAETTNPNNSTTTAQAIDRAVLAPSSNPNLDNDDLPSVTIKGAISPASDADFYAITLQRGERLVLDIDNTPGDLDIVIRIYDLTGQQIGYVDDVTADPGSSANYGTQTFDPFLAFRAPQDGTYYFSVESYGPSGWNPEEDPPGQGQTSGTYDLHVSVGPPASAAQLLAEDIDALISGRSWQTTNLTFSFPDSTVDYPTSPPDDVSGFQAFSPAQQAATIQLLQMIANVTSLTFTNATGTAGESQANLRYAENDQDGAAYAYYPGGSVGGTAWFNTDNFNNPVRGGYAWLGILHETGHALGLKHGHEFPAISFDRDSLEYSVMTYRSYPGGSITGEYRNESWGYPQTLMMLDIAALQRIYGANYTYNAGDSVYTWNPANGQMSINGIGQGVAGGNRVFLTVWDGGGNDTYDLSNYTNSVAIDLRPGEWSQTSPVQLGNLGDGRVARGNIANALLFEGDPRSLIENAIGGSGSDYIIANQAANRLTGGAGSDTFRWVSGSDAGVGALADVVTDFNSQQDMIDLSAIDARPETPENDAFTFVGTNAFSGASGELRYEVINGNAHLFADLDGDRIADMQIILNNTTDVGGAFLML